MCPTLIIQLQRMGDLVLTFPLVARLRVAEPERPIWILAEPQFFEALMPLTPNGVLYMHPDTIPTLAHTPFHRIINLSHREEAARLSGKPYVERERIGCFYDSKGVLRTRGVWALYRAALVQNNRHNLFHWADLPCLDIFSSGQALPLFPHPRLPRGTGRVGLFVGASEKVKRPDPQFWASLAVRLARRGLKPVFLGGMQEEGLAEEAWRESGLPHSANLAGRFSIVELVEFFQGLDLLVTPDTGPMHLAAWAGTLTLNISMGTANAWETAPPAPGHWVLRPRISCTGCWHCPHPHIPCRSAFVPSRIANVVMSLLHNENVFRFHLPGLRLGQTTRQNGLFWLNEAQYNIHAEQRLAIGRYWQAFFLNALGGAPIHNPTRLPTAFHALKNYPHIIERLQKGAVHLAAQLSRGLRNTNVLENGQLWHSVSPLIQPLSGYLDLLLANDDRSPHVFQEAMELAECFVASIHGTETFSPCALSSLRMHNK